MAAYWRQVRKDGAAGVLWQDPDIVIDPDDMNIMQFYIQHDRHSVWASVHKLWPASTMRDDWVWAHGIMRDGKPHLSQKLHDRAEWFALGFTYTPAQLLDLALPHMPAWQFGQVDSGLSAVARQHHISAQVARKCEPAHLHFYPREDDASWRPGHAQPATRQA